MKRVLNVGGGSKSIQLPPEYAAFEHVLLDIDPAGEPDMVLDGRSLAELPAGEFDAIYCSRNLEHYFRHEVPKVLGGFFHVLKPGGFAQIRVPDLIDLMRRVVQGSIDLEEPLYVSPAGPVRRFASGPRCRACPRDRPQQRFRNPRAHSGAGVPTAAVSCAWSR